MFNCVTFDGGQVDYFFSGLTVSEVIFLKKAKCMYSKGPY